MKESALGGHQHLSDGLQTGRKATTTTTTITTATTTKSKQFIS